MSVLNHIDRFIFSLWERNDQLSVYNPQIKTQYDTYSWVKDIPSDPVQRKESLHLYKVDLLESLMQNDNFPLQYIEDDGITFMRWALSRDIRNMLRWIRGPRGQGGPQAIKETNGTYGAVISRIIDDSISLDTREFQNKGDGLRYAEFVNIVRQGFKPGKPSVNIFGVSADDDYGHFASNYFWFMYGILPRNGITLDSLRRGLTQPEPNIDDTRNTFKFLGLLYNLKSEKVEILRGPDKDGKPDVEGVYDFIDPWKEVPRPFDHKVMYVDKAHNVLHQRQEKDKSKDGNSDRPENEKTKRLQREIDDINKRVKDYMEKNTKWRDNTDQNKKVTNWNKAKQDKQKELNAERNRLKAEKDDGNTDKQGSRHQKKVEADQVIDEPQRQSTPPRQQSTPPRRESTPPRPPQRQTSVTSSPSVQSSVSATSGSFYPGDDLDDKDSLPAGATSAAGSVAIAPTPVRPKVNSTADSIPAAPRRDANSAKPGNRGNLTRATALGGGRKPIAATAPAGRS